MAERAVLNPRGIFNFVMGLTRWVLRVLGYAALMIERLPAVPSRPRRAIIAACAEGLDPSLGLMHSDQRYRTSLATDLMEPARPTADELVLDLLRGRELSYGDVYRLTDHLGLNDGKRRLTRHDLRHTFGSMLVAAGADVVHVAGQLGDTVETVYRTYLSEYEALAHADRTRAILGKSLERTAGNSLQT